jgi:hypothetical protein
MRLRDVSRVLARQRSFMFSFMEKYLFSQIQVPRTEVLSNSENFDRMIDFCLRTRQRIVGKELQEAKVLFTGNFWEIRERVYQGDMRSLRNLVYSAPGVGQKIGNFILEVIIHYGEANPDLEPQLYVPIDTHVRRVFTECLGLRNVPQVGCPPDAPRYLRFQRHLAANTADRVAPIYFDYLWFVGKVFCRKTGRGKEGYSRGYRLCSMCWIKHYCIVQDKWITP